MPALALGSSIKNKGGLICLTLTLFLCAASTLKLTGDGPPSCHLRELELCAIGAASLFQNPNGIPVTETEFKRHCEYMKESCDCFHEYADHCMTRDQTLVSHLFLGDIFKLEKDLCTEGSEVRAAYMKNANCLRKVQLLYQRRCLSDLQVGLESIHKLDISARLPTLCCNANRMKECILPRIEEQCGQDALELVSSFLSRMFGSIVSVTCRNLDPASSRCAALLPKPGSEPFNGRNTSAISRIISSYSRNGY